MAHVLKNLGSEAVWVVYGDGLDEITTAGTTKVCAVEDGQIRSFELTPEDVGLPRVSNADLKGGNAQENAAALLEVLEGKQCPYRDIAVFNAAAALVVSGKVKDVESGIAMATDSIESGNAKSVLEKLIAVSNRKGE